MNGPKSMYRVKPVIDTNYQIDYPKVMYGMKNIHDQDNDDEIIEATPESRIPLQVKKFLQIPSVEITTVENQQNVILKQLHELKQQIGQMRKNLCISPNTQKKILNGNLDSIPLYKYIGQDIVIKADPTFPPYSLVGLLRLWGSTINPSITCFTHSSVSLPEYLRNFLPTNVNGYKSPLDIKFIWKDVGTNMELIISPVKSVPIIGEANIIRFLSRLGPPEYNFESSNEILSCQIDEVLDLCLLLINSKLVKDRQAIFKKLNTYLGKGPFFFSLNTPSIADAVLFSTCKNLWNSVSKSMSSGLSKWFSQSKQYFDISG